MPDKIIIIEFKLAKYGTAIDAIDQIKTKKYADKYKSLNIPVYLIGMSFDDKTKSMLELLWHKEKSRRQKLRKVSLLSVIKNYLYLNR